MRFVPMTVLVATLVASAATPSVAQTSLFRPPSGGFHGGGAGTGSHGGGPGGGGFHAGGAGQNQFGAGGGQSFGNGPRAGGRHFVGGDGGYRGGDRHRGYGAAVGAGVAGLAAGALIGGALANPGYDGDPGYGYGYGGYDAPRYSDRDEEDRGPVIADQDDDATPVDAGGADYCAQRYRSYDRASGTYLGFDGDRHPCP